MLAAIASLTTLGLGLGFFLGLAARHLHVESDPIVDEVEAMLPGSQCGQCGYPGCSQAASALVSGEAPATLCPPGGPALAESLAAKLGLSLDLSGMEEKPLAFARVNEETCIGCTRCYKVCPTDAIVGAPKQIHAVIQQACTSCGKCVEVCPTECLQMQPVAASLRNWRWPKPATLPVAA